MQGPECSFSHIVHVLYLHDSEPLKSRQPLYKEQNGWPQRLICSAYMYM